MEHFVTLFDSLFLPQGLALHTSMERHLEAYTLWVLCMDNETHEILTKFNLPNVKLLLLSDLETEELKSIKPTRSKGEYCWTLTPFSIRFAFEADPKIKRVTYLDADLWFRKSPINIFKELELSNKKVLITDHAYSPEFDYSANSGRFCVQFMVFYREGEAVRKWWEEKCVEWCFARFEDGKFGDQKYLDDWPERFYEFVHVLSNKELILAPWNAQRFPYSNSVCWHFHSLRIIATKNTNKYLVDYGIYPLPLVTKKNIYKEYLKDLKISISKVTRSGLLLKSQKKRNFIKDCINFFRPNRLQRVKITLGSGE